MKSRPLANEEVTKGFVEEVQAYEDLEGVKFQQVERVAGRRQPTQNQAFSKGGVKSVF